MSELPENPDNPAVEHEESDVNVSAIIWWGAGLATLALVVHVFLWWLQGLYTVQTERQQTRQFPIAEARQNEPPPEPRLQNTPQQDMQKLRADQESRLNGYGWVNKNAGIARIPIDEAMKTVVQRGLPTRNHEDTKK
jgi:hypothetical protein